jgi:hypothetical protein
MYPDVFLYTPRVGTPPVQHHTVREQSGDFHRTLWEKGDGPVKLLRPVVIPLPKQELRMVSLIDVIGAFMIQWLIHHSFAWEIGAASTL